MKNETWTCRKCTQAILYYFGMPEKARKMKQNCDWVQHQEELLCIFFAYFSMYRSRNQMLQLSCPTGIIPDVVEVKRSLNT